MSTEKKPTFRVDLVVDETGYLHVNAEGDLTSPALNARFAQALMGVATYITPAEPGDGPPQKLN